MIYSISAEILSRHFILLKLSTDPLFYGLKETDMMEASFILNKVMVLSFHNNEAAVSTTKV